MLKLTLTLAAALYAGFVIWGEPTEMASDMQDSSTTVIAAAAVDYERPVILGAQTETAVVTRAAVTADEPDPAAVAASAPEPTSVQPRQIGEPVIISLLRPSAAAPAPRSDSSDDLLRVTGSRVNLRSGPSTSNGVVGSLTEGTLAEALGTVSEGWIEIRDVSTGLTGFMAARFLEPS